MAEGKYKLMLEERIKLDRAYDHRRLRAHMEVEGIDVSEHKRVGFFWRKHILIGFAGGCKYELALSGRNTVVRLFSDEQEHEELSKNKLLMFLSGISEKR